jgi:hypothetical protein
MIVSDFTGWDRYKRTRSRNLLSSASVPAVRALLVCTAIASLVLSGCGSSENPLPRDCSSAVDQALVRSSVPDAEVAEDRSSTRSLSCEWTSPPDVKASARRTLKIALDWTYTGDPGQSFYDEWRSDEARHVTYEMTLGDRAYGYTVIDEDVVTVTITGFRGEWTFDVTLTMPYAEGGPPAARANAEKLANALVEGK